MLPPRPCQRHDNPREARRDVCTAAFPEPAPERGYRPGRSRLDEENGVALQGEKAMELRDDPRAEAVEVLVG